ncbi:MAG: hypothetical protein ACYDEP_11730 [Acidimicrobiales bacterium]
MGVDIKEVSWQEWAVGGGGLLLAFDLLVLPWWSVDFGFGSVSETGLGSPDGFLGVLAFLGALALAAFVAITRFSSVKLPEISIPWSRLRLIVGVCVAALVVLKFVLHPHFNYLSIGAWFALVLCAVVVLGAVASMTSDLPPTGQQPPNNQQPPSNQ